MTSTRYENEADLRRRLRGSKSRELPGWDRERTRPAERGSFEKRAPRAPERPTQRAGDALRFRSELQRRLLEEVARSDLLGASDSDVADFVGEFVRRVLAEEEVPLNESERTLLVEELSEELLGVGPLAPLLADPAVTDVLVNAHDRVFVERRGRLEATDVRFRSEEHVLRVIERIAARVGRRIDTSSPMADLRLPDGSRVNATLPPASPDGPTLSIRRFGRQRLRATDLTKGGGWSEPMAAFLDACVRHRCNVLISGGTGAGKSTLLGVLADAIPDDERVLTVEDTLELRLDQPNVVRLEARPPNAEAEGRITQRELVANSLRMRPDRLIVGEVRGGEALDMLQAMNTGHDGSLSTIHANAPRDALARLETLVLMAGMDLPSRAIREQMVAALDLIVHLERGEDGVRRVTHVVEMVGMEGTTPLLQEIFRFERRGLERGRVLGEFAPTGIVPRCVPKLEARGAVVPMQWFQP
ncbi:MAG: CpaF family protein [Myxococcota bacterium]